MSSKALPNLVPSYLSTLFTASPTSYALFIGNSHQFPQPTVSPVLSLYVYLCCSHPGLCTCFSLLQVLAKKLFLLGSLS